MDTHSKEIHQKYNKKQAAAAETPLQVSESRYESCLITLGNQTSLILKLIFLATLDESEELKGSKNILDKILHLLLLFMSDIQCSFEGLCCKVLRFKVLLSCYLVFFFGGFVLHSIMLYLQQCDKNAFLFWLLIHSGTSIFLGRFYM